MSIKDSLSNLIAANGYDINNDEVKSALLSLAGSNIIKLPLDKKHMAARILSREEYDKYITNGTADGSISKNNDNVYHYESDGCNNGKSYYISVDNNGKYPDAEKALCHYPDLVRLFQTNATAGINYELMQDNKNEQCFCYRYSDSIFDIRYVVFSTYQTSVSSIGTLNFNSLNILNKNDNIKIAVTRSTLPASNLIYTLSVSTNTCFRPVFKFVDNSKSVNIHY